MMNKKELTQFAKKIIHSQKGLKNRQLMHPKREWLTGVLVALGIFVASTTWSSLEYFKYQTIEQQATSQSAAAAAVYRESLVTEALAAYAAKAERLNTLLGENAPVIPDDNVDGEEVSTEPSEDIDTATTTQTTIASSDNQITKEDERQIKTSTSPEETVPSESSTPPVEEGSIQPVINI